MKIQVITNNTKMVFSKNIDVNSLNSPMSFDNYDLNIIDLTYNELWRYSKTHLDAINAIDDFISIGNIVTNTQNAKVLYVFPKNSYVNWNYHSSSRSYQSRDELKNQIAFLIYKVLSNIIPFHNCSLYTVTYERNITKVDSKDYESDFFFSSLYMKDNENVITYSISKKSTTVVLTEKITLTTCDILQSEDSMIHFVNCIFSSTSKDDIPEWVCEYEFYDDHDLKAKLKQENEIVIEANKRIEIINNDINRNAEFKSILYSSGDQLVNTVFSILQIMLDVDLSAFKDVYKEDFIIEKNNKVFIGEIKGVNSNVTYNHISQTMRHFSSYADDHPDIDVRNIKPLLIINPLRTVPVNERESIHNNQISFSEQNKCLILETAVLLKIFEKHLKSELSTNDCIELLFNNSGLLKI